jgi:hypothetical protein
MRTILLIAVFRCNPGVSQRTKPGSEDTGWTLKSVSQYYDLTELGNRNMFLQLINTYYSLDKTKQLIELLP